MKNKPTTEQSSNYNNLEKMSTLELLSNINNEDKTVPNAIEKALPSIEKLVNLIHSKMEKGGRLFYIGAGTSGRLGVLDASECPPTFGVPDNWVIGLIAGGDFALRKAVENAEDDTILAWKDLQKYVITDKDVLVGIAASGTTPYVIGGLKTAKENDISTGCIVCNTDSPVAKVADYPVEIVVGPEFVTGSTRMKSGTAQKLVLNMITTSVMIKLGRVKDNKMVHMQLSNAKLVNRGILMLMDELHINQELASELLKKHKSVKNALDAYKNKLIQ
ncbi:N-acetylmuramic acid 6-phosphate etherase [Lutibacter sp. A80]|uniref:N-acetylmuramic acid 6-phosphate etherase n=1 Tax=Lutibacter sp. A80 TaxID=2918453 RepID=UPI001F05EE33|nr:N-acetylmuramic acid 6-phosphate etherase [Lutibacter sp. A80]UMB61990.1 N-acetylmuramic acid 6-phosphate etherase [Lutibacter sp. A80]